MNRTDQPVNDWDPLADQVLADQRAAYDEMRSHCPVAYSDLMGWSLFRHEDVLRAVLDHETFSNVVSRHPSVPNGMDPPEHTVYRAIIVPYFADERMRAFEPVCREIVATTLEGLRGRADIELMGDFASVTAARSHGAFLGWPVSSQEFLIDWMTANTEATLAGDRGAQAATARSFEQFVGAMLAQRRSEGATPDQDVTASLMHEVVHGRALSDAEITSILRNWTAGEIGTVAAAIGIVVHYLAQHPELQERLRSEPATTLQAAIDEILRIQGPLVANRRTTTRPGEIGGRRIGSNERISLNWIAANRDEQVFGDPDEFRLDRDPAANVLYGAGIHVCPGAPLARLELRVVLEEMLTRIERIELDADTQPELAAYPSSGYASLPVRLAWNEPPA